MDTKKFLAIARETITRLDIGSGVTLSELIQRIAQSPTVGRPIQVTDLTMHPGVTGASFTCLGDACFCVFVNTNCPGRLRDLIIIHELLHILWRDVAASVVASVAEAATLAQSLVPTRPGSCLTYRTEQASLFYHPEREKEVEYVAVALLRKIVSTQERAFNEAWGQVLDAQ